LILGGVRGREGSAAYSAAVHAQLRTGGFNKIGGNTGALPENRQKTDSALTASTGENRRRVWLVTAKKQPNSGRFEINQRNSNAGQSQPAKIYWRQLVGTTRQNHSRTNTRARARGDRKLSANNHTTPKGNG